MILVPVAAAKNTRNAVAVKQALKTGAKLLLLATEAPMPELTKLAQKHGYSLVHTRSQRKTLAEIKKRHPAIIAAEFSYLPTYGSQLSNFESLIAANQTNKPAAGFLVFIHKENIKHFERLNLDNVDYELLVYPINQDMLEKSLAELIS